MLVNSRLLYSRRRFILDAAKYDYRQAIRKYKYHLYADDDYFFSAHALLASPSPTLSRERTCHFCMPIKHR